MKSVIFNQHQVNHALKNKEGMFRVVIKPQPQPNGGKGFHPVFPYETPNGRWNWVLDTGMGTGDPFHAPYQVGETIFVKEAFFEDATYRIFQGFDKIESTTKDLHIQIPARYMKQEYSRLFPRIKSVKVERLQDISEEDCLREGIETFMNFGERAYIDYSKKHHALYNARESFATLWNSTHKKPEEKWEASPWIFAYEYEVVR